jgi:transposase
MNGIYSSRKLEQACRRDVNFMYLLGREKAPRSRYDRPISQRVANRGNRRSVQSQLVQQLADAGELSLSSVFKARKEPYCA